MNIKVLEHLSCQSYLELEPFCALVASFFELDEFSFDSENETEWGISEKDGVSYNISRPYESGTLNEWDKTVPVNCNFGLSLGFMSDPGEKERTNMVRLVGERLSKELDTTIYYHRTWLGPGNNIARSEVYE